MTALTINGWDLPVRRDSPRIEWIEVGERSVAFDGTPSSAIRRRRLRLLGDLAPFTVEDAHLWRNFLDGRGWDYDSDLDTGADGWTYQGIAPATLAAGTAKYVSGGRSWLDLGEGAGTAIAWPYATAFPADDYAIGVLHFIAGDPTASYYWIESARGGTPVYYKDGVLQAWESIPSWLTIAGGEVRIGQHATLHTGLGLVVARPATGEGPTWTAASSPARPSALRPSVTVSGDCLDGVSTADTLTCQVRVTGEKLIQAQGAYYSEMSFELEEI